MSAKSTPSHTSESIVLFFNTPDSSVTTESPLPAPILDSVNPVKVGESAVPSDSDVLAVSPLSTTHPVALPTMKFPSLLESPAIVLRSASYACTFVPITNPSVALAVLALVSSSSVLANVVRSVVAYVSEPVVYIILSADVVSPAILSSPASYACMDTPISPLASIDSFPMYSVVDPVPLLESSIRESAMSVPICIPPVVSVVPAMCNVSVGDVVPIPILPLLNKLLSAVQLILHMNF